MFDTNTEQRINKLMEEKSIRKQKVKELINGVDTQLNDLYKKMSDLTDSYVTKEIEGNVETLAAIDKDLNNMRLNIENLQGKKEAYERLAKEDKYVKKAIPEILESARKERTERYKEINKKQNEKKISEQKIKDLESKIRGLDNEISTLFIDKESAYILPLLKYIEPREIKNGFEKSYISVLLDEAATSEYLDQYIEQ